MKKHLFGHFKLSQILLISILVTGGIATAYELTSRELAARKNLTEFFEIHQVQFAIVQQKHSFTSTPLFIGTYEECKDTKTKINSYEMTRLFCVVHKVGNP